MVADQNCTRTNVVLLRHFLHTFLLEQRAAGAAEWAVRLHQDTLLFAKVDNLLLRQVGVVLDLVGGGDNSCLAQQLLQVGNAEVRNANRLHLATLLHRLHPLPRIHIRPLSVEIARAVLVLGEEWVVAIGVHGDGPVHEPEINIIQSEVLQRLVKALLRKPGLVESAPQF